MIRLLQRYVPFLLIVTASLAVGCGYHFRTTGEPVGIRIEDLAIPLMASTSSNMGFEADFTRIIREEFISYAKVPLVSRERAQAVLTGRIYDIETGPLAYDSQPQTVSGHFTTYEVTNSRRLKIKLDVRLTDKVKGKVIWRDKAMEEKASFPVDTDPLANRFHQKQALEKIARRLAKRIFLKTMERF
jgi:hypothetical protein